MASIFAASHQSAVEIPFGAPDYIGHGIGYAVLGALVMRGLAGGVLGNMRVALILPAVIVGTLYGFSDEWHQSFIPGRMASWSDIAADAIGSVVGACAAVVLGAVAGRRQV